MIQKWHQLQGPCNIFLAVFLLWTSVFYGDASVSSITLSQNLTSPEAQVFKSTCRQRMPFGISDGYIKSQSLSSSSVYDPNDILNPPRIWGASQARLRTASCWCGGNAKWNADWIQVDLGNRAHVTGLAIQGDPLHPPNDIEEFYLQISDDGIAFRNQTSVKDIHGHYTLHVSPSRDSDHIRFFWFNNVLISRFIRFKPLKLLLVGHNAKFCLRFEIFGCPVGKDRVLYPIGLENTILPNSQIIASSSHIGEPPGHARLNKRNGWCTDSTPNQWLQFDIGVVLAVTAVAIQGNYGRNTNNMVSSYTLSYSNTTTNPFLFLKDGNTSKVLTGNNGTAQDPVMSILQSPIIARYIRINPLSGGPANMGGPAPKEYCIRAEIYAKHPACSADLTAIQGTKFAAISKTGKEALTNDYDIYSMQAWCSHVTSTSKVFQIDLGDLRVISGLAISGNPNSDSWITGFNVKLGLEETNLPTTMVFKGTIGRTDVSVNWLHQTKIARFLHVEPTTYIGHRCFRIRVLGCQDVPIKQAAPHISQMAVSENSAEFKVIKVTDLAYYMSLAPPLPPNTATDPPLQFQKLRASNTTGDADNTTVVLKYACVNSTVTKPCASASNKTVIRHQTNGQSVNLTGLSPGTKYYVTAQILYSESISYGVSVDFITSEPDISASKSTSAFAPTHSSRSWTADASSPHNNSTTTPQISTKSEYVSVSSFMLVEVSNSGNAAIIASVSETKEPILKTYLSTSILLNNNSIITPKISTKPEYESVSGFIPAEKFSSGDAAILASVSETKKPVLKTYQSTSTLLHNNSIITPKISTKSEYVSVSSFMPVEVSSSRNAAIVASVSETKKPVPTSSNIDGIHTATLNSTKPSVAYSDQVAASVSPVTTKTFQRIDQSIVPLSPTTEAELMADGSSSTKANYHSLMSEIFIYNPSHLPDQSKSTATTELASLPIINTKSLSTTAATFMLAGSNSTKANYHTLVKEISIYNSSHLPDQSKATAATELASLPIINTKSLLITSFADETIQAPKTTTVSSSFPVLQLDDANRTQVNQPFISSSTIIENVSNTLQFSIGNRSTKKISSIEGIKISSLSKSSWLFLPPATLPYSAESITVLDLTASSAVTNAFFVTSKAQKSTFSSSMNPSLSESSVHTYRQSLLKSYTTSTADIAAGSSKSFFSSHSEISSMNLTTVSHFTNMSPVIDDTGLLQQITESVAYNSSSAVFYSSNNYSRRLSKAPSDLSASVSGQSTKVLLTPVSFLPMSSSILTGTTLLHSQLESTSINETASPTQNSSSDVSLISISSIPMSSGIFTGSSLLDSQVKSRSINETANPTQNSSSDVSLISISSIPMSSGIFTGSSLLDSQVGSRSINESAKPTQFSSSEVPLTPISSLPISSGLLTESTLHENQLGSRSINESVKQALYSSSEASMTSTSSLPMSSRILTESTFLESQLVSASINESAKPTQYNSSEASLTPILSMPMVISAGKAGEQTVMLNDSSVSVRASTLFSIPTSVLLISSNTTQDSSVSLFKNQATMISKSMVDLQSSMAAAFVNDSASPSFNRRSDFGSISSATALQATAISASPMTITTLAINTSMNSLPSPNFESSSSVDYTPCWITYYAYQSVNDFKAQVNHSETTDTSLIKHSVLTNGTQISYSLNDKAAISIPQSLEAASLSVYGYSSTLFHSSQSTKSVEFVMSSPSKSHEKISEVFSQFPSTAPLRSSTVSHTESDSAYQSMPTHMSAQIASHASLKPTYSLAYSFASTSSAPSVANNNDGLVFEPLQSAAGEDNIINRRRREVPVRPANSFSSQLSSARKSQNTDSFALASSLTRSSNIKVLTSSIGLCLVQNSLKTSTEQLVFLPTISALFAASFGTSQSSDVTHSSQTSVKGSPLSASLSALNNDLQIANVTPTFGQAFASKYDFSSSVSSLYQSSFIHSQLSSLQSNIKSDIGVSTIEQTYSASTNHLYNTSVELLQTTDISQASSMKLPVVSTRTPSAVENNRNTLLSFASSSRIFSPGIISESSTLSGTHLHHSSTTQIGIAASASFSSGKERTSSLQQAAETSLIVTRARIYTSKLSQYVSLDATMRWMQSSVSSASSSVFVDNASYTRVDYSAYSSNALPSSTAGFQSSLTTTITYRGSVLKTSSSSDYSILGDFSVNGLTTKYPWHSSVDASESNSFFSQNPIDTQSFVSSVNVTRSFLNSSIKERASLTMIKPVEVTSYLSDASPRITTVFASISSYFRRTFNYLEATASSWPPSSAAGSNDSHLPTLVQISINSSSSVNATVSIAQAATKTLQTNFNTTSLPNVTPSFTNTLSAKLLSSLFLPSSAYIMTPSSSNTTVANWSSNSFRTAKKAETSILSKIHQLNRKISLNTSMVSFSEGQKSQHLVSSSFTLSSSKRINGSFISSASILDSVLDMTSTRPLIPSSSESIRSGTFLKTSSISPSDSWSVTPQSLVTSSFPLSSSKRINGSFISSASILDSVLDMTSTRPLIPSSSESIQSGTFLKTSSISPSDSWSVTPQSLVTSSFPLSSSKRINGSLVSSESILNSVLDMTSPGSFTLSSSQSIRNGTFPKASGIFSSESWSVTSQNLVSSRSAGTDGPKLSVQSSLHNSPLRTATPYTSEPVLNGTVISIVTRSPSESWSITPQNLDSSHSVGADGPKVSVQSSLNNSPLKTSYTAKSVLNGTVTSIATRSLSDSSSIKQTAKANNITESIFRSFSISSLSPASIRSTSYRLELTRISSMDGMPSLIKSTHLSQLTSSVNATTNIMFFPDSNLQTRTIQSKARTTSLSAATIDSLTRTEHLASVSTMLQISRVSTSSLSSSAVTTLQPIAYGLAYVPMQVPLSKDVSSLSFRLALERKIVDTYNILKKRRRKRDVTIAGTTAKITSLSRRGITEYVDVVFYVMEKGIVVAAQKTVDILNQMTLKALTQRFGDVVLGPVIVYGSTTIGTTTILLPNNHQLLGMVLTDSATNNMSAGNNRALFEKRMAEYYRAMKTISGTVVVKIYFLVHEKENIVYLEFYIFVNSVIQDSSTVEAFYKEKTISALSAVVSLAIVAKPYALSNIVATEENHIKMTFKVVGINVDVTSLAFKNSLALKITTLYREARDIIPVRRRRRALGSVTTYIVSSTSQSNRQGIVVFFILDKGKILLASTVVSIANRLSLKKMSTILGVEVTSAPTAVKTTIPTANSSSSYLWIIGVVVGGVFLVIFFVACLYYRWRAGAPKGILKLGKVELPAETYTKKKSQQTNSQHTAVVRFAEAKTTGGPSIQMRNFSAPPERPRNEENVTKLAQSTRKKIGYHSHSGKTTDKRSRANLYESDTSKSDHSSYCDSESVCHDPRQKPPSRSRAADPLKVRKNEREATCRQTTPAPKHTESSDETMSTIYENMDKEDEALYESIKQQHTNSQHTAVVRFAETKTTGGPSIQMRHFSKPPERPRNEENVTKLAQSTRKKIGYHSHSSKTTNKRSRANLYESDTSKSDHSSYFDSEPVCHDPRQKSASRSRAAADHAKVRKSQREATCNQKTPAPKQTESNDETMSTIYENMEKEDEALYESIKQIPIAGQMPPLRQLNVARPSLDFPTTNKRRFKTNAAYASLADLGTLPPIPHSRTSLRSQASQELDEALRQKAEIERNKNKLRQKEKAQEIKKSRRVENRKGTPKESESESRSVSTSSTTSSDRKSHERGYRFRKRHRIYIADNAATNDEERKPVKLNNYVKIESPAQSINVNNSNSSKALDASDIGLDEAREKLDLLLGDAFSLLQKFEPENKKIKNKEEPVYDEPNHFTEASYDCNQPESLDQRLNEIRPQLPLPFHATASAANSTHYSRIVKDLDLKETNAQDYSWSPTATSSPIVVMNPNQSLKYFAPVPAVPQLYTISPASFAYSLNQPLDESHIYLTPVQPQLDSKLQSTQNSENSENRNLAETSTSFTPSERPHSAANEESSEMQPFHYDYRQNPQSLIQYIKKELLRLSPRYKKGTTKIIEIGKT